MNELHEHKRVLRRAMREKRRGLDPSVREKCAARVAGRLFALPAWRNAQRVMAYCSMPEELGTERILKAVSEEGKSLSLPRCHKETAAFDVVCVDDLDGQMRPGRFAGLLEPGEACQTAPDGEEPDLVLVPGVAFDRKGARLGLGAGMYDRWFEKHPEPLRVALAYGFQLAERVPTDEHDFRMDALLTPEGVVVVDAERCAGRL